MTIRTAFTPEEIAAYMEANKPDHPTAKGIAGSPPRYVELEMILNQVEQELGERKSPHRRIWDAAIGLLAFCPPNQLDVARSWVAELIEANARLDYKCVMTGLIGRLGGTFKVADMIIEMRRIECDMAERLRTWHQAKLKSEWEERRQVAMQTLFEEDQDKIS